jgi:hypothetical protein
MVEMVDATGYNAVMSSVAQDTAKILFPRGVHDFAQLKAHAVTHIYNPTPATATTVGVAPILYQDGTYWDGAASATDSWYWSHGLGTGANGASTYYLRHSGSSGATKLDLNGAYQVLFGGNTNIAGTSGDAAFGGYVNLNGPTFFLNNSYIYARPSSSATGGANVNSPNAYYVVGRYWTGAASADDQWFLTDVMGAGANPTSTLQWTHSGTPGTAKMAFTFPVQFGASGTSIASSMRATATLGTGAIGAGTTATQNITVTGAVAGAEVAVGGPTTLEAGLILYGYVSAADTVTLRVANVTAGSITPAGSQTVSVRVFNP